MVIIRESPRNRPSPARPTTEWPPRSPFQALLSSPSGRQRWRDIRERAREVSPTASKTSPGKRIDMDAMSQSESSDDEESLKLKLEILETKRKLRDLKRKQKGHDSGRESEHATSNDEKLDNSSAHKRRKLLRSPPKSSSRDVEVPLSPSRHTVVAQPPASPARVRLGLDAQARAQDVSLKRPKNSNAEKVKPHASTIGQTKAQGSSFSQRLAQSRLNQQSQVDKSERLASIRSKTFSAVRDHAVASVNGHSRAGMPSIAANQKATTAAKPPARHETAPLGSRTVKQGSSDKNALYDSFSEIHLSKRRMVHLEVARSLDGVEIYTLPRLLKEVVSPAYEPPDCDSDFAVLAIIASKSSPFEQKPTHKTRDVTSEGNADTPKSKFMVLRLCDLQWELDCYLFGSGFDRYWKLTEGTLVAILNPGILPPKGNIHNGRFSLKLASSEDAVLEIGTARDLGYCSAQKKDGSICSSWINKKKTSVCEFHLKLELGKARKGRMEVNSMWRAEPDEHAKPKPKTKPSNVTNHWEYGKLYSYNGMAGKSAASLLDDDDIDKLHNMTQEEASRKRIAAAQRERDLAKKLGEIPGGVAGEYFRAAHGITNAENGSEQKMFVKPTAAELGLLSKNANDQRLSPAKDRRRHFGLGAVSSAGTEALGWGGARKTDLLEPRDSRMGSPERGQTKIDLPAQKTGSQRSIDSPSKRTRFALEQGIREPGRVSGGPELKTKHGSLANDENADDDDELEIV